MTETIRRPAKEIIEARAYQLYQQRGARDGNDLADWFDAERELNDITSRSMAEPARAATTKPVKRDVTAA